VWVHLRGVLRQDGLLDGRPATLIRTPERGLCKATTLCHSTCLTINRQAKTTHMHNMGWH
jgi:hypothetical protein